MRHSPPPRHRCQAIELPCPTRTACREVSPWLPSVAGADHPKHSVIVRGSSPSGRFEENEREKAASKRSALRCRRLRSRQSHPQSSLASTSEALEVSMTWSGCYNSLRWDDIPSNAHAGEGPIANTVRDPAATCVCPASICDRHAREHRWGCHLMPTCLVAMRILTQVVFLLTYSCTRITRHPCLRYGGVLGCLSSKSSLLATYRWCRLTLQVLNSPSPVRSTLLNAHELQGSILLHTGYITAQYFQPLQTRTSNGCCFLIPIIKVKEQIFLRLKALSNV